MPRSVKHSPASQPEGGEDRPPADDELSLSFVLADVNFSELGANSTNLPDASAPDIASPDIAAKQPVPARLPHVEEFRLEEAAAASMAKKLASDQNRKPQIKSRRPRYRGARRSRWHFPDESHAPKDESEAENRYVKQPLSVSSGGQRGLFWSVCTAILIVTGISAAFGFFQSLNDLLPERVGAFINDNSVDQPTVTAAAVAAMPMPPGATAKAAPATVNREEIRPQSNSGEAGTVDRIEADGVAAGQIHALGKTVLDLGEVADAGFATPEPAAPSVDKSETLQSAPADAAASGEASKNNQRKMVFHEPVKVAPMVTTAQSTIIQEQDQREAPQPVTPQMSAAEIDRQLARGEELLNSGDIASARLLFLRVAAAGDRRGAVGVGMTFDPDVYARIPVAGLTPDRKLAEYWYKKANEGSALTVDLDNAAGAPQAQ